MKYLFLFLLVTSGNAVGQTLLTRPFVTASPDDTYAGTLRFLVVDGTAAGETPKEVSTLLVSDLITGVTGAETNVTGNATIDITGTGAAATPYVVGLNVSGALDSDAGNLINVGPNGRIFLELSDIAAVDTDTQDLSLATNTLSLVDGGSVSLAGYLDNTDAQDLTLSGNTLSLTGDGTSVSLAAYLQDLGLSGDVLSLTGDGTTVDLSSYTQDLSLSTDTLSLSDDGTPVDLSGYTQDLTLSGNTLSLSDDATTVDLSGYLDNTDAQDLTIAANTLSLGGDATTVDLSGYLDNTDAQDLTIAANVLSLSGDATTVSLTTYIQDLSLATNTLSLSGDSTTVDLSSYAGGSDNLGNHTATTTLNLAGNGISSGGATTVASLTVSNLPTLDNAEDNLLARKADGTLRRVSALSLDQDLSLATNTLSLTGDGTPVDLSAYLDNTDAQDLTIAANTLSLGGDATAVDLSGYLDANTWSANAATQDVQMGGFDFDGAGVFQGTGATLSSVTGLKLSTSPTIDNTETEILVRDTGTGIIQLREVSSLPSGGGGGGAINFVLSDPDALFDIASLPSTPVGSTTGSSDTSIAVENYSNAVATFTKTGASWSLSSWSQKDVLSFRDAGGVEGTGLSLGNQRANWALLKVLEGVQDTAQIPIYFDAGDWEFAPTIPAVVDINNPWLSDHIEWDAGITAFRGAGMNESRLHFPNRDYYFFLRQRSWDCSLSIEDLSLVTSVYNQSFTASATTDRITAAGHAFPKNSTYAKFSTTGTLPAPLDNDTQSSKDRVKVIAPDTNTFFVAAWLTPVRAFTSGDVTAATDVITIASHGYANGDLVVLETSAADPPAGLSADTRYYVVGVSGNDFKLEATLGGGAIDITDGGTGNHTLMEVIDLTDAGSGTHTIWEIGERSWLSAGYHIGAASGSGLDTGIDSIDVHYKNVAFHYIGAFSKVSSDSAVNLLMENCEVINNTGVPITSYGNRTGTEGTDWTRPWVRVEGSAFHGGAELGGAPFGNHFMYFHAQADVIVSGNHIEGCYNIAVQFQTSSLAGVNPGSHVIAGNYFENNEQHVITAGSKDDQSRIRITGNTFDGGGQIGIRADCDFVGNTLIVERTPAFAMVDDNTDDTLRDFHLNVVGNTFLIRAVSGANAVFSLSRDGAHSVNFAENIIKRDAVLSGASQVFIGQAGSAASGDLADFYFHDNVYDIDGTGGWLGWFLYSGHYRFENEHVDSLEALALTVEAGAGGTIRVDNCEFQMEDEPTAQRAALAITHTGWTFSGKGNHFHDASYIDNDSAENHLLEFGDGRNPTSITAAATVYPDASYTQHVVTGTTTIDTITVGVTGNEAVDGGAAATNYEDVWTGAIMLIVPDTLTLSGAGNIANGPYTATGAEALTLIRQDDDTWLIAE